MGKGRLRGGRERVRVRVKVDVRVRAGVRMRRGVNKSESECEGVRRESVGGGG